MKMTTTDSELLQQFARDRSGKAFAVLVSRHVDLVYSAALRQVRSSQLAEEVAQTVFLDLSRSADKLTPDTILTAWLYRVTRRAAIDMVRSESRRQLREQIAVELADMNSPDTHWKEIEPLLDEAMETLDEQDRSSILLRYFENKSLREVGETLGTSDDAAQKRVSRAVERLREYFSKSGISVGSGGFAVLLSSNAVQAAPIALSATISSVAITGGTVSATAMIGAGKTLIMTTTQKALIGTALAAALGTGVYEMVQNSRLRNDLQRMEQKMKPLAEQNEQLRRERDEARTRLLSAQQDADQARRQISELPKLRGDVARLRERERELAQLKDGESSDPVQAEMKSWLARVSQLKQRLEANPDQKIPELQFVTEQDWLNASRDELETEKDFRQALSHLRAAGENKFVHMLQPAWTGFLESNQGKHPTDLAQLKPYFKSPMEDAVLQRYKIVSEKDSNMKIGAPWTITQKAPVDEEFDGRFSVGPSSWSSSGAGAWNRDPEQESSHKTLAPILEAYKKAYGVREPSDFTLLRPFATTPEQHAEIEKLIEKIKAQKESETK